MPTGPWEDSVRCYELGITGLLKLLHWNNLRIRDLSVTSHQEGSPAPTWAQATLPSAAGAGRGGLRASTQTPLGAGLPTAAASLQPHRRVSSQRPEAPENTASVHGPVCRAPPASPTSSPPLGPARAGALACALPTRQHMPAASPGPTASSSAPSSSTMPPCPIRDARPRHPNASRVFPDSPPGHPTHWTSLTWKPGTVRS